MEISRFHHRIEYTRNKHSRAVCRGDTIVIRLARNLSKTEERDHIQSLLRRMTHLILKEHRKIAIDPFRPLLDGAQSLTLRVASGRTYSFALTPGRRTVTRRTRDGWHITIGPQVRRRSLHRFLWSLLGRAEQDRMRRLVDEINQQTLRISLRDVRVRFATTQWGSCSTRGVIMLNTALLFLPPSVLTYVIVHELAHRRVANHSPAYWTLVESALPAYEQAYRELQEYRLPHE